MRPNSAISIEGAALSAFWYSFLLVLPATASSANAFACAVLIKNRALVPLSSLLMPAFSSAFFANLSASAPGASARICSFTSSAAFLVRLPTSSRASSAKAARMACFHACEDTRARVTPPYTAVLGLPVSSRLMQLGGTVCKMWKSTYRRLFISQFSFSFSSGAGFESRYRSCPHRRRTLAGSCVYRGSVHCNSYRSAASCG